MGDTAMNILFAGHSNAGKSTLVAQFLLQHSAVDKDVVDEVEEDCNSLNLGQLKLSWMMDKFARKTFPNRTSSETLPWELKADSYEFVMHDVPATKTALTSCLESKGAEIMAACLTISAYGRAYEEDIEDVQRTALLIRNRGIKHLVVAITQMDATEPAYDESRYNEISTEISSFVKKIGFPSDSFVIVPISGVAGDNIFHSSDNLAWYGGWKMTVGGKNYTGLTLEEILSVLYESTLPSLDASVLDSSKAKQTTAESDAVNQSPNGRNPKRSSVDLDQTETSVSPKRSKKEKNIEDFFRQVVDFIHSCVRNPAVSATVMFDKPFLLTTNENGLVACSDLLQCLPGRAFFKEARGLSCETLNGLIEEARRAAPSVLIVWNIDDTQTELWNQLKNNSVGSHGFFVVTTISTSCKMPEDVQSGFAIVEDA